MRRYRPGLLSLCDCHVEVGLCYGLGGRCVCAKCVVATDCGSGLWDLSSRWVQCRFLCVDELKMVCSCTQNTGGFYNFSNIRYAAPPVGELRFAPPQAPAENRSAVNTGTLNRICPQAGPAWSAQASRFLTSLAVGASTNTSTNYVPPGANSSSLVPAADPREDEDCLFLDVFVPEDVLAKAGKGYGAPVLVWIYGGGYTGRFLSSRSVQARGTDKTQVATKTTTLLALLLLLETPRMVT